MRDLQERLFYFTLIISKRLSHKLRLIMIVEVYHYITLCPIYVIRHRNIELGFLYDRWSVSCGDTFWQRRKCSQKFDEWPANFSVRGNRRRLARKSSTCFSPRYLVASGNASPICIPDTYDVVRIVQYMDDALKIPHGYLEVYYQFMRNLHFLARGEFLIWRKNTRRMYGINPNKIYTKYLIVCIYRIYDAFLDCHQVMTRYV